MKEVGWMSELFSPPFSGEDGQIQFITTADKTGKDSEVAPSLSFPVVARSVSSFSFTAGRSSFLPLHS